YFAGRNPSKAPRSPMPALPRIAIGSFMLESNAHSPVATREEFAQNVLIAPSDLLGDLRGPHPRTPGWPARCFGEIEGIAAGWRPVPLIAAAVGASGPIEQSWFDA